MKNDLPQGGETTKNQFPCPGCGANLEFKPGTSSLVCPYCGREHKIEAEDLTVIEEYSLEEALANVETRPARELAEGGKEYRCRSCGAATVVSGQASRCPFCDSPVVLDETGDDVIIPESVLPFGIERRQARQKFKEWVKSRWFAPSDLAARARREEVDGVYIPYWTYDSETRTAYQGQRGTYYYVNERHRNSQGQTENRRVRKTRWHSLSGTVRVGFDDVLVCASKSLPRDLVRKLEPWDLADLSPYQPSYLSGFLAERYSVNVEEGFQIAEDRMQDRVKEAVRRDIGGDDQRITSIQIHHDNVRFKHFLLPLWITSFRYKDKVFRFITNARTGEPAGERPYSTAKIAAAVVGALAALGALVLASSC